MQKIIQYLHKNEDALKSVKEGTAYLLSVSQEELQAILEVYSDEENTSSTMLWK